MGPKGKMFQNVSSLKPLGQLKPNYRGIIIGRSCTKFHFFYADRKSKMAITAEHRLTLLIIFVVSEKKAFEHFPIGSNVNLCSAVMAILDLRSA
jgi:hypothetical protein